MTHLLVGLQFDTLTMVMVMKMAYQWMRLAAQRAKPMMTTLPVNVEPKTQVLIMKKPLMSSRLTHSAKDRQINPSKKFMLGLPFGHIHTK